MPRLKVWGGLTMTRVGQRRTVVATTNQKDAAKLIRLSLYEFRGYWTETFNKKEVTAAMSKPGVVFRATADSFDASYEQINK